MVGRDARVPGPRRRALGRPDREGRGPGARRARAGAGRRGRWRSSSPTGSSGASRRASSRAGSGSASWPSSALFSLSHGTNDAQKTMGIIFLALVANGNMSADADIPTWVVVSSATAIALGTYFGGWRIVRTMGIEDHQDGPGAGLRGAGRRRGGDPVRLARRLPAVDDAGDVRRDHGRRRGQAAVRGALGRGGEHRAGVDPDAAVLGRRGRVDVRRGADVRRRARRGRSWSSWSCWSAWSCSSRAGWMRAVPRRACDEAARSSSRADLRGDLGLAASRASGSPRRTRSSCSGAGARRRRGASGAAAPRSPTARWRRVFLLVVRRRRRASASRSCSRRR